MNEKEKEKNKKKNSKKIQKKDDKKKVSRKEKKTKEPYYFIPQMPTSVYILPNYYKEKFASTMHDVIMLVA